MRAVLPGFRIQLLCGLAKILAKMGSNPVIALAEFTQFLMGQGVNDRVALSFAVRNTRVPPPR